MPARGAKHVGLLVDDSGQLYTSSMRIRPLTQPPPTVNQPDATLEPTNTTATRTAPTASDTHLHDQAQMPLAYRMYKNTHKLNQNLPSQSRSRQT